MNKNNEKIKITKLLLQNKRVNNYTKLMIILSTLNYYEDYYIPNRKLMNMLGIEKNRIRGLLHQLEEDKMIAIFYKGRKRFFTFLKTGNEDPKVDLKNIDRDIENMPGKNLFDYNWLEEEVEK